MKFRLQRQPSRDNSTLGTLYVQKNDGDAYEFVCYTLEDVVRPVKVPGQTAIPVGEYVLQLSVSNRLSAILPELLDVPGFSGIRIHSGNTHADTFGCILVGLGSGVDNVSDSKAALRAVLQLCLTATKNNEAISIEILS